MQYYLEDLDESTIKAMAKDFIDSDMSLRDFAREYCNFSYNTLWMKLVNDLYYYDPKLCAEVKERLDNHKAKDITEDPEAQNRVFMAAHLFLNKNVTIPEIAKALGVGEFVIERDLTKRAAKILKPEVYESIRKKLEDHSRDNLIPKGRNSR